MSKRIAFGIVGLFVAVSPMLASAQSTTDLSATINALLAQVQALQAQLASLQTAQTQGTTQTTTANTSTSSCVDLASSIGLDDEGSDVTKLQKFLLAEGVYSGDITGRVGPKTVAAIKEWQTSHGLVSSGSPDTTGYGFVGPKTRAAMACAKGSIPTPQSSTLPPDLSAKYEITALYQSILGRAPDTAGLNYWVGQVTAGTATLAQVGQNFAAVRDITALYQSELGRAPDTDGLNYYVKQYLAGGITLAQIKQTLINSKTTTTPPAVPVTLNSWGYHIACSASSVVQGGNISATISGGSVSDHNWVTVYQASDTSSSPSTFGAAGFAPTAFNLSSVPETVTFNVPANALGAYEIRLQTLNGFTRAGSCAFTVTPAPVVTNTATPVVTTTTNTQTPVTTTASPSITQQITALYQSILQRAPDTAGLNYWVGQVTAGTVTLSYVERNFAAVRDITALYQSELQRAPDQAGLDYYVNQYLAGGITLAQIKQTLINSKTTATTVTTPTVAANVTCSAASTASVAVGGSISVTVPWATVNDWAGVFRASETASLNTVLAPGFSPSIFSVPLSGINAVVGNQTVAINVRSAAPGSYQVRLQSPGLTSNTLCTFTVTSSTASAGTANSSAMLSQLASSLTALLGILNRLGGQ